MKNTQLFQLLIIQFKEYFREPGALFWSFMFPILMAWGLGIAFTEKPELVRNVAYITPQTPNSSLDHFLIENAKKGIDGRGKHIFIKGIRDDKFGISLFKFIPVNKDSAEILIKRGTAVMILSEEAGKPVYQFDPANPDARLVYIYVSGWLNNRVIMDTRTEVRTLTSAGMRYIDFLIPGLIAMGIMSSCLWGVSYNLIEKRSKKLLRRMIATPMKKSVFLIAQVISRITLTFIESAFLIVFAHFFFHMQIQGSILALVAVFIAGNIAFIGISILISSHTSNTQIGNGLINAVTMPMMLLSGVFFSYHNFPAWTVPFIQQLPLTQFADGIRGIIIEGAGFKEILLPTLSMTGLGTICFVLGMKFYKWY
jgi:ABC-2 type transport system permease protein